MGRLSRTLLERALAAALLVALSPLILLIALLVRLTLGSPVLFRQTRPGLHGEPFTIVKFRTMTDARVDGVLVADHARITRLGHWLRATSLDELPTLWNVVRGEMAFVGPRPLLVEYLTRYTPEQARRHDVRPGITGIAQVRGRNDTSWADRLALDVWYVDHRSLPLDLRILWETVGTVTRRKGVSAPGHVTMPEFPGDQAGGST